MPENEKDVQVVPSTTEEQAVNNGDQLAPEGVQSGESQVQGEVQSVKINEVEPTDERGVPLQNVEMEYKRKYEQLIEKQPELINEAVKKAFEYQQTQKEPQYTEEQLDMIIFDDTGEFSAANKAWASQQKGKLQEQKISQLFEQKFQLTREEQRKSQVKAESEKYVVDNFPEMFNKDASGNVQWNMNNPMTKIVAHYMSKPEIASRPDAVREATRQAYVDYQLSTRGQKMRQDQLTASQAAQLKKQQMNGGTGIVNQASTTTQQVNELYERFRRTGDPRDGVAYKKALANSRAKKG